MDKAKITIVVLVATAVLSVISIYLDANINNYSINMGNHSVSYALIPEPLMILIISYWAGLVFDDYKISIILGVALFGLLFVEMNTPIGNDFWNLFTR